ncbi:MAG TPA: hypothetical protein VNW97_14690 [Candidatus Saccharimonadales bacterium]|jgi:hypothetical protein|nr:hypothetical protein [Candidatus Saccharimonadales bacterium]
MRTFKICLYEIITALALLGLAHVYLGDQRLLPFAQVMLVALYVLTAVATEAVIASSFRPEMWRVISLNVPVAAIVSVSGRTSDSSLKISTSIAIGTLILRALVADISLRGPKVRVRRITAALVGGTLLLETLATVYSTGERIYYDYYFYPKTKEGYIMPTRWQDFVGYAVFLGATILVLYLSCRLLKYAFRHEPALTI